MPRSPEDSYPFPVSPEVVPPLALSETSEEATLPPWLEAVSCFVFEPCGEKTCLWGF